MPCQRGNGACRGAALTIAIGIALLASIIVYGLLVLSSSAARRAGHSVGRLKALYLSEAGLVIATQRLSVDPNYCPTTDELIPVPTDDDPNAHVAVRIEVTNCGAGQKHMIHVKTPIL